MLLFNTNNRYNGNKFTIILSKQQLKLEKSIKKLISASYQKNNTGGGGGVGVLIKPHPPRGGVADPFPPPPPPPAGISRLYQITPRVERRIDMWSRSLRASAAATSAKSSP